MEGAPRHIFTHRRRRAGADHVPARPLLATSRPASTCRRAWSRRSRRGQRKVGSTKSPSTTRSCWNARWSRSATKRRGEFLQEAHVRRHVDVVQRAMPDRPLIPPRRTPTDDGRPAALPRAVERGRRRPHSRRNAHEDLGVKPPSDQGFQFRRSKSPPWAAPRPSSKEKSCAHHQEAGLSILAEGRARPPVARRQLRVGATSCARRARNYDGNPRCAAGHPGDAGRCGEPSPSFGRPLVETMSRRIDCAASSRCVPPASCGFAFSACFSAVDAKSASGYTLPALYPSRASISLPLATVVDGVRNPRWSSCFAKAPPGELARVRHPRHRMHRARKVVRRPSRPSATNPSSA